MRSFQFLILTAIFFQSCSFTNKDENLLWSDEFNGKTEAISEKWNIITGNGCPEMCGFGNNEFQYYTENTSNLKIENGHLIITALHDPEDTTYTSAKITSENKGDFKYGYIEVRAKLPEGRGTWPAIWMLPSLEKEMQWPLDGEIDIMEHVGYNQDMIYGTIHTEAYNHTKGTQKSDSLKVDNSANSFHIYAIDWQKDYIEWSIDGEVYNRVEKKSDDLEKWPFDKSFHIILNFAVGGNWGGKYGVDSTVFPQTMEIDYVRVYTKKATNP